MIGTVKITKEQKYYPSSLQQQGVWLQEQLDPNKLLWVKTQCWQIDGELNVDILIQAIKKTISSHDSLRTSFDYVDDRLLQVVNSDINLSKYFLFEDFSNIEKPKSRNELQEPSTHRFNLFGGPLVYFYLRKLGVNKFEFEIRRHHIISDITSSQIIFKEILNHYESPINGTTGSSNDLKGFQYTDYAKWQQEFIKTEDYKKQKAYWINKFKIGIPQLNIKPEAGYKLNEKSRIDSYELHIPNSLVNSLKNLGLRKKITFSSILILAQYILLSKYSGQDSIVIGTISNGRNRREFKGVSGIFANKLALILQLKPELTILEALQTAHSILREAYENQDVVFQDIQSEIGAGITDLIKSIYNYIKVLDNDAHFESISIKEKNLTNPIYDISAKEILSFNVFDKSGQFKILIRYPHAYFSSETIERIAFSYRNILEGIISSPETRIRDLSILSKEEKGHLLLTFNNTYSDFPSEKTIHQLFEEQVERNPNEIAVVFGNEKISYEQLNNKANIIAHKILEKSSGKKVKAGLLFDSSMELIVSILGVLKSGSAYVPLAPDSPEERNRNILSDCQADILLAPKDISSAKYRPDSILNTEKIIYIDNWINLKGNIQPPLIEIQPTDSAYVIYTSGTTGKPKGVEVRHIGVVNFINWRLNNYGIDNNDVTLQLLSYQFDGYGANLYSSILSGGKLVLIHENKRLDANFVQQKVIEEEVTNCVLTPGLFELILKGLSDGNQLKKLRLVVLAGEKSNTELIKKSSKNLPHIQLANEYGPTESSIGAMANNKMDAESTSIIGKPISNTQIYILGEHNELLPVGVAGELCISGVGIAKGYVNNEGLTSARFIENPFSAGLKMYKTGDLARWLPNGDVEFLGRIDSQIKIRGFRVELEEIEHCLNRFKGVESIVLAKGDIDKYICAYYVSKEEIKSDELKKFLARSLPDYMLPTYYFHLDRFPLTSNGKIDVNELQKYEPEIDDHVDLPLDGTEKQLAKLWANVLNVEEEKIGRHSNFFFLGGQSLKAMSLMFDINRIFGVEVSLNQLFKNTTIKQIADLINDSGGNKDHAVPQSGEQINIVKDKQFAPIQKLVEKETYSLSPMQRRMYFLHTYNINSVAYNMPQLSRIKGDVDIDRLEFAYRQLIERHDIFRTSFIEKDDIIQFIHPSIDFTIAQIKCEKSEWPKMIDEFIRPFDLQKAPLLRVGLLSSSDNEHLLMSDMPHIISDGLSQRIIKREFIEFYAGNKLPEIKLQYKDFSEWYSQKEQQEHLLKQKEYWLNEFREPYTVVDIPADYTRPVEKDYIGKVVKFEFDNNEKNNLIKLKDSNKTSLFTLLYSAFYILLAKLTNQDDIVIGTPVSGRIHPDTENIVGLFINTLAIRNYPQNDLSFKQFLDNVKEKVLSSMENQSYPFEDLVETLELEKHTNHNPLFEVIFSHEEFDDMQTEISGLHFEKYDNGKYNAKFDFSLITRETPDSISCFVNYSSQLFNESTIRRFISYYKQILGEVYSNPDILLADIDILSQEEKNELLAYGHNDKEGIIVENTFIELFCSQVLKTPMNKALIVGETSCTYKQLDEESNRIADWIRKETSSAFPNVTLLFHPSVELVTCILAVQKAGRVFVPLSPDTPVERNKYIISDCESRLLLTHSQVLNEFSGYSKPIVEVKIVNVDSGMPQHEESVSHRNFPVLDDLIYIIYTSGTTGKPKGVEISHRGVANYALWKALNYKLNANDITLQLFSYHFDGFGCNFYPTLISGGALVLISKEKKLDTKYIFETIKSKKVTNTLMTPSLFDILVSEIPQNEMYPDLRFIALGGEKSGSSTLIKGRNSFPHTEFYNEYGPTEASIASTYNKSLDQFNTSNIGAPIANTSVYILGKEMELLPLGAVGELCISGYGIAKGYYKNIGLTNKKFIKNPFKASEKLYRTGDLGRRLPDGSIEFVGRLDDQIKIRGFRIELKEIEKQILNFNANLKVCLIDRKEKTGTYLIAYYVSDQLIDEKEIKGYLSAHLPNYMIPAYFIRIEEIPLTGSGKLDKNKLPLPQVNDAPQFIPPSNIIESQLVDILSELLHLNSSEISINKGFFELGGHSLTAVKLVNRINQHFNVNISVNEIFKRHKISEISETISKSDKINFEAIPQVIGKEKYKLSPPQRRIYFLHQFDKGSLAYNMPIAIQMEGELDRAQLHTCFGKLVLRHEIFRTAFFMDDDGPVQTVSNDVCPILVENNCEDENIHAKIKEFIRPFDLKNPPLIRAELLILSETKHILLVDMHHIISDGVSFGIFFRELSLIFNQVDLPAVGKNYFDYSEWLSTTTNKVFTRQKNFWLNEFKETYEPFDLPLDFPRTVDKNFDGSIVRFELDEQKTLQLKDLGMKNNASFFMVILSILNVLLSKLSNQEDIVIGTPVSGRGHPETEPIIGLFINTLAIRNRPLSEMTFNDFLLNVRDKVLSVFENQLFQYEELVENLQITRNTSRNPLFDVMLMFQNFEKSDLKIPGIKSTPYNFDECRIEKFDISFIVNEINGILKFSVSYSKNLFKESTIKRYESFVKQLIDSVLSNPDQKISELEIISGQEKKQILLDFNNTKTNYPNNLTVIDLLENQVKLTPKNIALRFGNIELTYSDFNEKVNQLANLLIKEGVQKGDIIGIVAVRSIELVQGIFSILKAGATYLPLDPKYPEKRVEYILKDSGTKLVLCQSSWSTKIPPGINFIELDSQKISNTENERPNIKISSNELAYIIYTSGTTGNPKGVMVRHKSLSNIIFALDSKYPLLHSDSFLFKTSIVFDVSVSELFGWFLHGGSLTILPDGIEGEPDKIVEYINQHQITHVNFVPSMFTVFINSMKNEEQVKLLTSIKYFLLAGEEFSAEIVGQYKTTGLNAMLENIYGPTEATVYSSAYSVDTRKTEIVVPIGKPLSNVHLLIFDKNKKLQPVGVPGELYIGGDGLAKGYLNNKMLTEEKFIDFKYPHGNKLYHSGDMAKWLPDGNIEYLGRIDDQVKIRGFRIELSEIIYQLNNYEGVLESVVLVFGEENNSRHLKAFITTSKPLTLIKLKKHLRSVLPEYMIPSHILVLKEFPLTLNGKIDRKKLLDQYGKVELESRQDSLKPQGKYEAQIADIWSNVLNISNISLNDSFFDIGGHSLATLQVIKRIESRFGVRIEVKDFFHNNLKQISDLVEQQTINSIE